ncbi:oligopeptide transporter, OPT family [bacterium]|nr:oligopeptide transporter, OPT family [bacterium]
MPNGSDMTMELPNPTIPSDKIIPEFTPRAILLGIVLGIIFGAANAYLGLYVGMTVSASIPVAVISMGIMRKLMRGGTILENNMVQTVGSAGESLAAGVIFTLPALFIWAADPAFKDVIAPPTLMQIFIIAVLGGFLGVLFMIPLRKYLIVSEHHKLPYPEGRACAEVLRAGEAGGQRAGTVFWGVGIGAAFKALMSGVGLWKESPALQLPAPRNMVLSVDAVPALLGVGYIIGPKISSIMLLGGALGGIILVPLFTYFGENGMFANLVHDYTIGMGAGDVRNDYVKYVGVGAVAFGGIASLVKSLPAIFSSFASGIKGLMQAAERKAEAEGAPTVERTDQDLSMAFILIASLVLGICVWLFTPASLIGAVMVVLFSFFFVTVSSRIVGLIGSSSNPASGMTIATLLGTSLLFVMVGYTGPAGMVAALTVGGVVCVAICIAGDTSQDLKTGFLLGATPRKQQIGEFIGVFFSALVIGGTVFLLSEAYGFVQTPEHPNPLLAPQANLMAAIIRGVMQADLPWSLIILGMIFSLIVELLKLPSLAFAVGLYLPMGLSVAIMGGGVIRWLTGRRLQGDNDKVVKEENGTLYASGLIAGEALMGILIAILVTMNIPMAPVEEYLHWFGDLLALIAFGVLAWSLLKTATKKV